MGNVYLFGQKNIYGGFMGKNNILSIKISLLSAFFALTIFSFTSIVSFAAGTGSVNIDSVTISGGNVLVNVSSSELPASDDGLYYLFAEKPYQDSPIGNAVAQAPISASVSFSVPLGHMTVNSHLYDKFQVGVRQGGIIVAVTGAKYITNPEALAINSVERLNNGKKGIILDGAKIGNGNTEVLELGVKQGAYNINLPDIIGGNRVTAYVYNGKQFYFDSAFIAQCDFCIKTSTSQGIGLTMVLLNPYSPGEEFLLSPSARGGVGSANYYQMNTSEDYALEYLEAVVAYLAYRYNGRHGFGQVDNWVIANEVNAKNTWNYSGITNENEYARLYSDSLRVCYNAIKSENANAYVCISLDHNWTHINNGSYFSARSMLDLINSYIAGQGNIDWGLAYHPYNYPIVWTEFWNPKYPELIAHNINTPYMSMENIEQLTDYMCQPALLNTKGAVRPILLTEIGYSSKQSEEAQAAAMMYAYQRCATNRYINFVTFNRQTDDPLEVRNGLSAGLSYQDGRRKVAYEFFQNMDSPNAGAYIQRSAALMGIQDWNASMNAR